MMILLFLMLPIMIINFAIIVVIIIIINHFHQTMDFKFIFNGFKHFYLINLIKLM